MTDLTNFQHRVTRSLLFAALTLLVGGQSAQAQINTGLGTLFSNQVVPTGDIAGDKAAAAATIATVANSLSIELATIPVSSSSGGFVYLFNPKLGVVERASDSFGPFFAERALRPGRRQASFGWTYQRASYSQLDGFSLADGNFVATAALRQGQTTPFSVDTLSLNIDTAQMTLFGNYGISDRLDVSVAVPVVSLTVDGRRINTAQGRTTLQSSLASSATGLGDVALRGRYQLFSEDSVGVAAGADLRLPTGNSDNLLGAGKTALKLFGIGSIEQGSLAEHVNLGFTVGGLSPEFNYNAAATYAVRPRITIVGEVLGRWVADLKKIESVYVTAPDTSDISTLRWIPTSSGTNIVYAVAGVKWNFAESLLLNANCLFRVTEGGLTSRVVPGVALDYSFGRQR